MFVHTTRFFGACAGARSIMCSMSSTAVRRARTDDDIRELVRAGLAAGTLPATAPMLTIRTVPGEPLVPARVAGASLPDRCAVCGESSTNIRYNVPNAPIAFHTRCRQVWEEQLRLRERILH